MKAYAYYYEDYFGCEHFKTSYHTTLDGAKSELIKSSPEFINEDYEEWEHIQLSCITVIVDNIL